MALRTSARSETGFAIIEAVVAAAVLAIVAMAVLSGIDAASNSSGREKARAVASSLAEQDQERLRSMPIEELSKLGTVSKPVSVDGVTYQVESKAEWITDDTGGTPACGSSKNNEYLHIATKVSSAIVGHNVKAIQIDSLVAPSVAYSSTHGILVVKLIDRNSTPLVGLSVTIESAAAGVMPKSGSTDPGGCVYFRQLPVGTYTITLNQGGYVSDDLVMPVVKTQKVAPGVVTFKTIPYDKATGADITVKTNVPGQASTLVNSRAAAVSLTNAQNKALLKVTPNSTGANPVPVSPLYPFKLTKYAFFTGSCAYESPDLSGNPANNNYFGTFPESTLLADPTVSQPQTATVRQPPFRLRITSNSNNTSFTTTNLLVYAQLVRPAGQACSEPQVRMKFAGWPGTGVWGLTPPENAPNTNWVVQNIAGFDPGMPFGDYTICLQDTKPNTDQYLKFRYDNTTAGGAGATSANPTTGWTSQRCVNP